MMAHCQQIRMQCLDCGRSIGNAIAHNKVHPETLAALQPFDEELRDSLFNQRLASQAVSNRQKAEDIAAQAQRTLEARKQQYAEYLKSERWRQKRRQVIDYQKGTCRGCLSAPIEEVHHLSYDNIGDELLFQLVGLCRPCHAKAHKLDA